MSATLKGLSFTSLPKIGVGVNPVQDRRNMVIKRLEEQKELLANPTFQRTVNVVVKNGDGSKTKVAKNQKIHPWYTTAANGSIVFFVRLGWKPVEFAKGQSGIAVPSPDKLPAIIDQLIGAVRAGELDQQLEKTSAEIKKAIGPRKKKAS